MTTADIISEFGKLRVLVAGDLCLNRWWHYNPDQAEPSSETGIPRVAVISTSLSPGGSGAVVSHLAALRTGRISVLGLLGGDGAGYELERVLAELRVSGELLLRVREMSTAVCTRFINDRTGQEDLPRVDLVDQPIPMAEVEDCFKARMASGLAARLEREAGEYDAILVSGHAEPNGGVIISALTESLMCISATRPELLIWVDFPGRLEQFRDMVVKLNCRQADSASRRALGRVDYVELRRVMGVKALVISRGSDGALVVDEGGTHSAPGRPISRPLDPSAAATSFSGGAALALKVTGDPVAAARFGNLVASIAIAKPRPGIALREEAIAAETIDSGVIA